MLSKIDSLVKKVEGFSPSSKEELESFRLSYLGKKGHLTSLFNSFKEVPNEQKKEFGLAINNLKNLVQTKISSLKPLFSENNTGPKPDLFKPVKNSSIGSRHPISIVEQKIISVFNSIGFSVSDGPEIEDDWHNFTALNLPSPEGNAACITSPKWQQ